LIFSVEKDSMAIEISVYWSFEQHERGTSMTDTITSAKKPMFLRIGLVLLVCSTLFQVYFFTIINGILNKEFNTMGVLEGIIEWIYLVGPSFFLAVVFYGLSILCCLISHFLKETSGKIKWYVWGYCVVDPIAFMLITQLYYG